MVYFSGKHQAKCEKKGRIWIPFPYNRAVKDWVVFTNEFMTEEVEDGLRYVIVCPADAFEREFSQHVNPKKSYPYHVRDAGRVYIPKEMRDYAGIENDIMILGTREALEVWNLALFEEQLPREEMKYIADMSRN